MNSRLKEALIYFFLSLFYVVCWTAYVIIKDCYHPACYFIWGMLSTLFIMSVFWLYGVILEVKIWKKRRKRRKRKERKR